MIFMFTYAMLPQMKAAVNQWLIQIFLIDYASQ